MRKQCVLAVLRRLAPDPSSPGVTADQVANDIGIKRNNASADLNELCREGLASKNACRPVQFWAARSAKPSLVRPLLSPSDCPDGLDGIVGASGSLREVVEQAKAAILYPPNGLPTLIIGPTGTGKSYLAEAMYQYAIQTGRLTAKAPFNIFNCADYAANPQLLLAQLFGYVKGAFTGAERNSPGLVAQSCNGVLFLDEVHRLAPEGQEMLFVLIDKGIYRALGDAAISKANVVLLAATSEEPSSVLLKTFLRRFPVVIQVSSLDNRPQDERLALVERFLAEEAYRIGTALSVSPLALVALLSFHATGNAGELRSAVQLGCSKAFLNYVVNSNGSATIPIYVTHLAPQVQLAYLNGGTSTRQAELFVGVEDRIYYPKASFPVSMRQEASVVPYAELKRRVDGYLSSGLTASEIQRLIQTDVNYYLQRLVKRLQNYQQLSPELISAVGDFINAASRELGRRLGPEVVTGLSLHLMAPTINDAYDNASLLAMVAHCPREYKVVRSLVTSLEGSLNRNLSPGEIAFLAIFLASQGTAADNQADICVLVVAHGNRVASGMANVANRLLGIERVQAVDMPLEQSVDVTFELVINVIKATGLKSGVILLVDMGSLTSFGADLEQQLQVAVAVIPLVTTAAVIEAGWQVGRCDVTLDEVARNVRRVYQMNAPMPVNRGDKRVIITTCLTGQGTAQKLVDFLYEGLPLALREQVVIYPVDLGSSLEVPSLLIEGWRGSIVAAVGTVDPRIPKVDFIGMEAIVLGEGLKRLVALMEGTRIETRPTEEVGWQESVTLACRFVQDHLILDGCEQICKAAVKALTQLEEWSGTASTPGQAARWVIHFAFMLERLRDGSPMTNCAEMASLQQDHSALLQNIWQTIDPIGKEIGVEIPEPEIGYLATILLSP